MAKLFPTVGLSQLLAADLMEILGVTVALSRAKCADVGEGVVRQAKNILAQCVDEHVEMQELASSLDVSYRRFRQMFKQLTGFAPYQYHLQLRIGRSKQLLAETDLSIKEIANLLKFDDTYHFSKMFKRHAGMSPSHWRNSGRTGLCR